MSYNINGFENKFLYPNFFRYITSFDILILVETHTLEDKAPRFHKYLPGFEISWIFAKKINNFGRASGGVMLAINKNVNQRNIRYDFQTRNSVLSIIVSCGYQKMTIVPLYIRSADWENEFSVLKRSMYDFEIDNLILLGDVNVRIGELQQVISPIHEEVFAAGYKERKSMDKEVNGKGRKYLDFCNDFNLTILNGQTEGDKEGHCTFISTVGSSVNDICAISQELLHLVQSFQVDEQIWSDHLPIILELKLENNRSINNKLSLLPKISWKESNKDKYQRELSKNLAHQNQYTEIKQLTDIIISSTECVNTPQFSPHNKWFDTKCYWARKKVFMSLNKFRKSQNEQHRVTYMRHKKAYGEVCQAAKLSYFEQLHQRINNINNGKEWWKLAKEINRQEFKVGNAITANTFKDYFMNLLNPKQISLDIQYAPSMIQDSLLDGDITLEEIKSMLSKVKLNKAPGEDRVPYEFYIHATDEFLLALSRVYSNAYRAGSVEELMVKTIIFPIHKKGDFNDPANYRAISFMNTAAKIFMGILNQRLAHWVEENGIMVEYQAGFRRQYSTADNIYNLASIAAIKLAEKKKLYAFFVDFRAAFDNVSRKSLIYKLFSMGISFKFVRMIESLYESTKSAVWNGHELSTYFDTTSGVKQGCLLSPLLFALYINDLHEYLEGGIVIQERNIRILMYADDIVIMAEEIQILQSMIHKLEEYCNMWNMEVNTSKSKIMVFRNGGRLSTQEKWYYKGQELDIVAEYAYLGAIFTPKLTFKSHVINRISQAKNAVNSTWKHFLKQDKISLQMKWKIYLAVCRSIEAYAAQVWGFAHFEEVDKFQRFFLKRILKLPENTPNYVIDLETNVDDGHKYTLQLHLQYIYRSLFEYNIDRLPNFLSKIVLEKKIFWAKSVNDLLSHHGEANLEVSTSNFMWYYTCSRLLETLSWVNKQKKIESAMQSNTRMYKNLDYNRGSLYLNEKYDQKNMRWIMKARADMLFLNANNYSASEEQTLCTLCNLQERETIQHFLGKCPILAEIRRQVFGIDYLPLYQIIDILNGHRSADWENLIRYLRTAMKYRSYIMNEYQ